MLKYFRDVYDVSFMVSQAIFLIMLLKWVRCWSEPIVFDKLSFFALISLNVAKTLALRCFFPRILSKRSINWQILFPILIDIKKWNIYILALMIDLIIWRNMRLEVIRDNPGKRTPLSSTLQGSRGYTIM